MKSGEDHGRFSAFVRAGAICSLILAVSGCGGGPAEPERYAPAEALQGTWRWVSSLDVKTQQLHTPASDGVEAELAFAADSELEGSFAYRRTGAPEVTGRFGISSEDSPGNDFVVLDQSIDFLESHAWLAVGPDSLWLGGGMEGGYNSRYVRVSH